MSLAYMGVPDRCEHGEYEDRECPQCELKRLRAIVDNLPKTADGVPVTPGMTLWGLGGEYGIDVNHIRAGGNYPLMYSTSEAAAQAAKNKRPPECWPEAWYESEVGL